MDDAPDPNRFESMYAGKPPWDTGRAQRAFVAVSNRIVSPVLDVGCGTGENALFLTLGAAGERFASAIDSALFHVFSDGDRRRYVAVLERVVESGGRLFLMCFSDADPGTDGPRRISRRELDAAFASGWEIESVEPVRFEINPEVKGVSFSEGRPKAWFAVIRRTGSAVPE